MFFFRKNPWSQGVFCSKMCIQKSNLSCSSICALYSPLSACMQTFSIFTPCNIRSLIAFVLKNILIWNMISFALMQDNTIMCLRSLGVMIFSLCVVVFARTFFPLMDPTRTLLLFAFHICLGLSSHFAYSSFRFQYTIAAFSWPQRPCLCLLQLLRALEGNNNMPLFELPQPDTPRDVFSEQIQGCPYIMFSTLIITRNHINGNPRVAMSRMYHINNSSSLIFMIDYLPYFCECCAMDMVLQAAVRSTIIISYT